MPLHHSEWHGLDLSSHHLDLLYFNADKEVLKDSLKVFKKSGGLKKYKLSSTKSIDKVIHEIEELEEGKISPSLYDSYSSNLRKAVDNVFSKDTDSGLSEQLRASVARFAAFKACTATREIKSQLTDDDYERAVTALKTYNRFQTAEYNTTVSRCRTAKQFEKFADPESTRIFPNLRWLPSRSVTPREEHQVFYNRVWSKDDPFWQKNTPGSLWNCKCDWEETDDDVTDDNPQGETISAQGLKGNPAITGEVFSDDHSYFQASPYELKSIGGVLRTISRDILKSINEDDLKISIPDRGTVNLVLDKKSVNHLCNDITVSNNFLLLIAIEELSNIIKKANPIAHMTNGKRDKKPWAVEYYYFEIKIGYSVYYVNIEENYIQTENRHFYRIYAISDTLHEGAIMY